MELTFLTRSLKPPVSVMAQDQEDYTLAVPDSSPWGACPLLPSGDCSPVNSKSHKWLIYAYPIYRWVITHQLLTGRILWTVDTTKSISRHELWNLLRSPVAHYRQGILKKVGGCHDHCVRTNLWKHRSFHLDRLDSWISMDTVSMDIYGHLGLGATNCYGSLQPLGLLWKGRPLCACWCRSCHATWQAVRYRGSAKGETSMIMLSCG